MSIENNGIIDGQNIFALATRAGFTYPSSRGPLTTDQLWDLHLSSKNMFDLDHTARLINNELKGMTEESFVNTKPNPAAKELVIKLEVVKFIIATKQAEAKKAADARARAEERATLVELKEVKKLETLKGLTQEEIDARLAALDADAGQ